MDDDNNLRTEEEDNSRTEEEGGHAAQFLARQRASALSSSPPPPPTTSPPSRRFDIVQALLAISPKALLAIGGAAFGIAFLRIFSRMEGHMKKGMEISEKAVDVLEQAANQGVEFGIEKRRVVAHIIGEGNKERKNYKFWLQLWVEYLCSFRLLEGFRVFFPCCVGVLLQAGRNNKRLF